MDGNYLRYMKPKIIPLDGYNATIHISDIIGTVVPNYNRWGMTNGWKIIEIYENKDSGTDRKTSAR